MKTRGMGIRHRELCRMFNLAVEVFGVDKDYVRSRCRTWDVVRLRHMIAAAMTELGFSVTEVGAVMCRSHSTVIHSQEVHGALMKTNKVYREEYARCKARLCDG